MTSAAPPVVGPVFAFGGGASDGDGSMKDLLGGKGAGLAEMTRLGLPVPPGFTITTEMCSAYYANGQTFPDSVRVEVANGIAHIEKVTGKVFGDPANPLLVSRTPGVVSPAGVEVGQERLGRFDAQAHCHAVVVHNVEQEGLGCQPSARR